RWCSYTACGQEFWQILSQWIWNIRLELGHRLSPTLMRLTEWAPAEAEPQNASLCGELAPVLEGSAQESGHSSQDVLCASQQQSGLVTTEHSQEHHDSAVYGPPDWARTARVGLFSGSDFTLQADGTLRCPTDHPLYPQERRAEHDGTVRVVY